ncbi:MAG: hypothetical protein EA359_00555, partial [Balneolaceae bacterium]
MKPFILCIIFLISLTADSLAQLERERVVTDQFVELTFMAPRNINLFTVETLSKGELHYSIMHTFGEVESGARNLWGIDQGANVRFSFEYGFGDRISLGFGRSSLDKVYDIHARWAILRQKQISTPVSVILAPSVGITTGSFGFLDQDYSFSDRISYSAALPIARKFSNELSLQLVPMITHFSRTGAELNIADPDTDTYFSIGFSGRLKVLPRSALTLQAIPPVTNAENLDWNVGIGID